MTTKQTNDMIYNMKSLCSLLLLMIATIAPAQGFDLYFANNVTDVTNLNENTVEQSGNGLNWTKVDRGTVNVYGNYVEVNEVRQMFASTRMKTLADQQQFWRMRDHSLVCFRINDGDGKTGEYGVEADDGYGTKLTLTVSKFFYSNIPLQERPVVFKVWKIGEVGDTLRFKYASDDWNDGQLFIFQLDSKRQMNGESYTLEYDLSYSDENSELREEKHYLDLKSKNFQSFYVPDDKTLADIFLMSGSTTAPKDGQKRLRLNLRNLVKGVTPYNKYENLTLSPRFMLDKHENRELVNFNWIGSGLYERFDTLYIKLKKPNGDDIRAARMNIVQIDDDGNEVLGGSPVKYIGWDEGSKVHKVLTNGNPAYIEILPPAKSNTFFPLVMRYRGATDPLTNIVDEERCSAEVMAVMGNVNYADFAISSQYFRGLHDEKKIIMYRGQEHALCTLEEYNMTGRAVTDAVSFSADGCQDGLKMYKGNLIEKYGELLLTFSTPKAGMQALRHAAANAPELKVYDVDDNNKLLHTFQAQDGASLVSFAKFERDYYDVSYDLTDLTLDKTCRLKLVAGNKVYDKIPYFTRFQYNRDDAKDDATDDIDELMRGVVGSKDEKPVDANGDADFAFAIPLNFKWDSPIAGLYINSSFFFDLSKKTLDYRISAEYRKDNKYKDEDGNPDGSKMSQMREDFEQYHNWDKFGYSRTTDDNRRLYEASKTNGNKGFSGGLAGKPDQQELDGWVFKEFDDIFSMPVPGLSLTGGFKLAGSLTKLSKDKDKDGNVVGTPWSIPTISDAQAFFKLAYGAFIKNPLKMIGGKLEKVGDFLDKYTRFVSINALAEASFEVTIGYKNWQAADFGYSSDTHSLLVQAMLKARGGITAEIHTPPNPLLHLGIGARAGAKLGIGYAYCTDFTEHNDHGGVFVGLVGVEGFAYVRGLGLNGRAAVEGHIGKRYLFPKDTNENPFHAKYPYWAKKTPQDDAPLNDFWQSPSLTAEIPTPWQSRADSNGESSDNKNNVYGEEIVADVASTANPHFLDEHTIVYDVPATDGDVNTAHIAVMNTKTKAVEQLSAEGLKASNHMRSKNTTHEIVVYEEMTRPITAEEIEGDDANAKSAELACRQNIVSNIRDHDENAADKNWHRYTVSAATGDMVKAKPVVTIQEDGRAACIWQQGQIVPVSSSLLPADNAGDADKTDDDAAVDAAFSTAMNGHLVLSVFDKGQWSEPVKLFELNESNVAKQYDLIMRNDTVLVGINMTRDVYDDAKRRNQFTYASVPLKTMEPSYAEEALHPMRFFMNRVGDHSVIALLYEKNDTLTDIYVKTLAMNGTASGAGGNDLGANFCSPNLVKIICDREAADLDDFAILWTEMSNTVHGDQGTADHSGNARMILNASRITLLPSICVTAPLTMGAEMENMMMNDFDGFLDDQHMKVVYSLSNLENGSAVIRECERYFDNSFIFDVNYTKSSLLGSSTLPVCVTVFNTGTSSIRSVTPTINGQSFTIDDSWVQPLSQRDFIVQYPIDSNFDGYIETSLEVEYQNVFRAQYHAKRPNRSLRRQSSEAARTRVSMEDIEMRIIGQDIENGTNTFAVELIDHSTNGLRPDNAIHVGLYSQPTRSTLLADGAEAVVHASDFEWFGGVRKAYAKVELQGVSETTNAFMACHIFDESRNAKDEDTYVDNIRYSDNIHYVYLQPSNDPTDINPVHFNNLKDALDVKVSREEGGVRLSGLPVSDDSRQYRLRVIGSDGVLYYTTISQSSTLFVPLNHHDVYLLSTGKNVLKFQY